MKYFSFFILLLSFTSCQSQNNSELTSINYHAQTRGFLVDLSINQQEVIYNNNNKIDTLDIAKEKWKLLKQLSNSLDLELLKNNVVSKDLLAVDRAILAEITFIINNEEQQLEFIHGDPPEELKELVREIFSSVSK